MKVQWLVMSFEGLSKMSSLFIAADEEAFEDNSEEYIRRDLEGSGIYFGFSLVSLLASQS